MEYLLRGPLSDLPTANFADKRILPGTVIKRRTLRYCTCRKVMVPVRSFARISAIGHVAIMVFIVIEASEEGFYQYTTKRWLYICE